MSPACSWWPNGWRVGCAGAEGARDADSGAAPACRRSCQRRHTAAHRHRPGRRRRTRRWRHAEALTSRFGGKGGGRPELAQGGGFTANHAELLEVGENPPSPGSSPGRHGLGGAAGDGPHAAAIPGHTPAVPGAGRCTVPGLARRRCVGHPDREAQASPLLESGNPVASKEAVRRGGSERGLRPVGRGAHRRARVRLRELEPASRTTPLP